MKIFEIQKKRKRIGQMWLDEYKLINSGVAKDTRAKKTLMIHEKQNIENRQNKSERIVAAEI